MRTVIQAFNANAIVQLFVSL